MGGPEGENSFFDIFFFFFDVQFGDRWDDF